MRRLSLLALFFGLGPFAHAESTYTMCITDGQGHVLRCNGYSNPGTGPGTAAPGGRPVGSSPDWHPPPGIFSGVKGDPKLDEAYHRAMYSAAMDGQSAETRARFAELNQAIAKYGSAPAATTGITREYLDQMKKEIEEVTTASPTGVPGLPPVPPPPGVSYAALRQPMREMLDSSFARDPFRLTGDLDTFLQKTADPGLRRFRGYWKASLAGRLTDSDGLLLLPSVSSPATLVTSWYSPEGRRVRHGLNQVLVSHQILEGEYQSFCERSGKAACDEAAPEVNRVRGNLIGLELTFALADRLAYHGLTDLFEAQMRDLEAFADFSLGVVKGAFTAGSEFVSVLKQFALHPIMSGEKLVAGLGYALYHYDETYGAIKKCVVENLDVLLTGTAEQRGEVVGRLAFNILSAYVGGKIVGAAGSLVTQATGRALTFGALEHVASAAVRLGEITAPVRDAFLKVAEIFPETGRQLWNTARGALDTLVGMTGPVPALAGGIGGADEALALMARSDARATLALIREEGLGRAGLNATYRESFLLSPEEAQALAEEPRGFFRESAEEVNLRSRERMLAAGRKPEEIIKSWQEKLDVGDGSVPKNLDTVVARFEKPIRVKRLTTFDPAASPDKPIGNWVMRTDPTKYTREELAHLFGLPESSRGFTHVIELEIPPGVPMRGGFGATLGGGRGPIQWQILMNGKEIPRSWIVDVTKWGGS